MTSALAVGRRQARQREADRTTVGTGHPNIDPLAADQIDRGGPARAAARGQRWRVPRPSTPTCGGPVAGGRGGDVGVNLVASRPAGPHGQRHQRVARPIRHGQITGRGNTAAACGLVRRSRFLGGLACLAGHDRRRVISPPPAPPRPRAWPPHAPSVGAGPPSPKGRSWPRRRQS